jgi:hypothetical protein
VSAPSWRAKKATALLGARDIVRAEPQHPQPAQLQRPPQAARRASPPVGLGQVRVTQREEALQQPGVELARETRQLDALGVGQEPDRHTSDPTTSAGAALARVFALVFSPLMLLPEVCLVVELFHHVEKDKDILLAKDDLGVRQEQAWIEAMLLHSHSQLLCRDRGHGAWARQALEAPRY